ncbi:MAG TPA: discoidin domain-containing protein [Pseudonocardiaceae bacterium]|jgi:fibronectin type 3 domain-containing protein
MRRELIRLAATASAAVLVTLGLGVASAAAVPVPAPPTGDELHANSNSSITISWPASAGATSYHLYRGTSSGGEGNTPIASTTGTTYTDSNLSTTPVYFYQITAVNSAGESARTPEDASKTPPPIGTGGNVAGVPAGNGELYYAKDALLGGFDWFQTLTGWFPQDLGSGGSASPTQQVVDMAYSTVGTLTFNNVVVPSSGLYTIDWRYAFQGGLFPGVNNRQMGLMVDGTVITSTQRFPITGSFDTYQHTFLQAHLNAGVNSVTMFAVTNHGVSRVDQLTVTPATASVPSGPTNLTATQGNTAATLSWTAAATGSPTSYTIYRGTQSDGEANAAVGTVSGTTTTFTDTGLHNGTKYFYNVAANNAVGVSPDSNEVVTTPAPGSVGGGGGTNLAQGQVTTASSIENAGTPASNATDGNTATRWSSAFSDPQWLQVDLGATHTITQVVLMWENAFAKAYQIQVSPDGVNWTTIYATTAGPGGTETLNVTGSGRYIRMSGTQRATQYGYSLWEFQVHGS